VPVNSKNEKIKRKYFKWLKEATGLAESTSLSPNLCELRVSGQNALLVIMGKSVAGNKISDQVDCRPIMPYSSLTYSTRSIVLKLLSPA